MADFISGENWWMPNARDKKLAALEVAMYGPEGSIRGASKLPKEVLYEAYGIGQDPISKLSALFSSQSSGSVAPQYRQPAQYEGMSQYMPQIMGSFNQRQENPFGNYLRDLLGRQK